VLPQSTQHTYYNKILRYKFWLFLRKMQYIHSVVLVDSRTTRFNKIDFRINRYKMKINAKFVRNMVKKDYMEDKLEKKRAKMHIRRLKKLKTNRSEEHT